MWRFYPDTIRIFSSTNNRRSKVIDLAARRSPHAGRADDDDVDSQPFHRPRDDDGKTTTRVRDLLRRRPSGIDIESARPHAKLPARLSTPYEHPRAHPRAEGRPHQPSDGHEIILPPRRETPTAEATLETGTVFISVNFLCLSIFSPFLFFINR